MASLGYARLGFEGPDLASQIMKLEQAGCEFIQSDRWDGNEEGEGGALQSVIERLQRGDTLVVQTLDRLGGGLRDVTAMVEELVRRDVVLKVLEPDLVIAGDLALPVLAALQMAVGVERSFMRERQELGMRASRSAGRKGGPRKVIDQASVVSLHSDGLRPVDIARRLGISRNSVYRELAAAKRAAAAAAD